MNPTKLTLTLSLLSALCLPGYAQSGSQNEVDQLKAKLAEQQRQIDALKQSLESQMKAIDSLSKPAAQSPAETAPAPQPATAAGTFPATQGSRKVGQPVASGTGNLPYTEPLPPKPSYQGPSPEPNAPLSWNIGAAKLTPLGFVDLTEVFRTTNVGSGIGTNFNAIPFKNAVAGNISESRLSLQNSRVGFRLDSTVLGWNVLGYLETDFLGNAPTNLSVTSNSNTLRMRVFFADLRKGQLEILGGQSWSLLTPNRKGLSPIPGDIFYSQDMDTNYQIGLTWARDPQFRVVWHPSDHFAWGVSFENQAQFLGAASASVVPAAFATSYPPQFETGASATGTPNLAPVVISKMAYDGGPAGHAIHVELAGLVSPFHVFNPLTGQHFNATGFGGSFNSNIELFKNFRFIENAFWSDGGGRWMFGSGPDLAIKANGDISPIHSGSTVDGFEYAYHPEKNPNGKETLFYAYYGGVYYGRDVIADTSAGAKPGTFVGYGFAGSPASQNRTIQEATFGITQTLWKNPAWGDLKLITQYSYLWRNPWSVAPGTPRSAISNMVFVDLRYDIP